MPLPQVRLQLKSKDLSGALQAKLLTARKQSAYLPDYLANKACQYISLRAAQTMPKASIAKIDSSLEVMRMGVTKGGKPSKAKNPRRVLIFGNPIAGNFISPTGRMGGDPYSLNPLASKIVLASMYPESKFNKLTGQVWRRNKPNTHGSADFWKWVFDSMSRMVKARHSSIAFFAACAKAVNYGFGLAVGRIRGSLPAVEGQESLSNVGRLSKLLSRDLARVEPSKGGIGRAKFSVAATEADTKGSVEPKGIVKVAQPVWQRAVNAEVASIRKEIELRYRQSLMTAGIK